MEIPKRSGIYLIVLPKWKSGYIGRSSNLKRRYEEHLQNSHKEAINKYIELYSEFEFLVLEYTDDYKPKDQAIIEESWIERYKTKLYLLNITKPTDELMRCLPKAVIAFNQDTLEKVGEWDSMMSAAKYVKGNITGIYESIKEKQHTRHNSIKIAYKGLYWFEKENFSQELLLAKKEKHKHQLEKRKNSLKRKPKKVKQLDSFGNLIKIWESTKEIADYYGCCRQHINNLILGKRYSEKYSSYTWEYTR